MTSKTSAADPLLRNLREPGPSVDATMLRVCWQAADEIDRLRRELKEMEARAISAVYLIPADRVCGELRALHARAQKLLSDDASADAEFEKALRAAGVPQEPLAVYTSNSYRRVGLASTYREVMYADRHPYDGHPDITGAAVLDALVAAFNAMLKRRNAFETTNVTRLHPENAKLSRLSDLTDQLIREMRRQGFETLQSVFDGMLIRVTPEKTKAPLCERHGQIVETDCPDCEAALGRSVKANECICTEEQRKPGNWPSYYCPVHGR